MAFADWKKRSLGLMDGTQRLAEDAYAYQQRNLQTAYKLENGTSLVSQSCRTGNKATGTHALALGNEPPAPERCLATPLAGDRSLLHRRVVRAG